MSAEQKETRKSEIIGPADIQQQFRYTINSGDVFVGKKEICTNANQMLFLDDLFPNYVIKTTL